MTDEPSTASPTETSPTEASATEPAAADPVPSGRNPVLIAVGVVAVVAVAMVALFATAGAGNDEAETAAEVVADTAPPLVGETITGADFDLRDLDGSWVLVNFFATWCPPCVAEHPELVALSKSDAFDAEVVSVAFDEPTDKVAAFFAEHGGDWPVVAQSEDIPLEWAVIGLPESFLVSPDGMVVKKYKGQITAAGIQADIRELA